MTADEDETAVANADAEWIRDKVFKVMSLTDGTMQMTPMETAIAVYVGDRAYTNARLQWTLDPQGMAFDAERDYRKFVWLIHWAASGLKRAPADSTAHHVLKSDWIAELTAAVTDDLRQKIMAELGRFFVYADEELGKKDEKS